MDTEYLYTRMQLGNGAAWRKAERSERELKCCRKFLLVRSREVPGQPRYCMLLHWRHFMVVFLDEHECKLTLIQPLKSDTCLGILLSQCSHICTHTHTPSQSSSIPRRCPISSMQTHTHTYTFLCFCPFYLPLQPNPTLPCHYFLET